MAKKTKFISVNEIQNAYEIRVLSKTVHKDFSEEMDAVIDMLFFQTRSHIQIDLEMLEYFPLPFLTQLLKLARDLRLKKRFLVLVGLNLPAYLYLQRFGLLKLLFPNPAILRDSLRSSRE
ncbi:hypothetical protein P3G55_10720 [Leptospira sp. 96542]|nr:hypothetical protein [Leptospira sp. 96542]